MPRPPAAAPMTRRHRRRSNSSPTTTATTRTTTAGEAVCGAGDFPSSLLLSSSSDDVPSCRKKRRLRSAAVAAAVSLLLVVVLLLILKRQVGGRNADFFGSASSSSSSSSAAAADDNDSTTSSSATAVGVKGPCAINLYGLPRSFRALVLPSLIRNVLQVNARYGCDYYVHYHHLKDDPPGRDGRGGSVDPDEVLDLARYVPSTAKIAFRKVTEREFRQERGDLLEMILTAREEESDGGGGGGRRPPPPLKYMPWNHPSYTNATVENVVKMWHGQEAVWNLMVQGGGEERDDFMAATTTRNGGNININNSSSSSSSIGVIRKTHYSRVAMLRCDVVYATPIDIYRLPSKRNILNRIVGSNKKRFDANNEYAVIPSFAKHPVNDRAIVGPYDAVRIWAAGRFERLERHIRLVRERYPGDGVHSERFLAYTIFPAIRDAGIEVLEDPELCFFRSRADRSIRFDDCGLNRATDRNQAALEEMIKRKCRRTDATADGSSPIVYLECKDDDDNER